MKRNQVKVFLPTKETEIIESIKLDYFTVIQNVKLQQSLKEMFFAICTLHKRFQKDNPTQGVNISSKQLKTFDLSLTHIIDDKKFQRFGYAKQIELIIQHGLIEKANYCAGKFTNAYLPTPSATDKISISPFVINTSRLSQLGFLSKAENKKKFRNFKTEIDDCYKCYVNETTLMKYLEKNFGKDLKSREELRIVIDGNDYPDTQANRNYYKKLIKSGDAKYAKFFKVVKLDNHKVIEIMNDVVKINAGYLWFATSISGRLYTSFSNLNTEACPFLETNGQKLVEVDAVNCQPLLMSSLVNNSEFKKLVEDGLFYEYLTNIHYKLGYNENELHKIKSKHKDLRYNMKIASYREIFFNNNKISKKWKEYLHKDVVDAINSFKDHSVNTKLLWYKLQKIESEIFLTVNKMLGCTSITRHDAILCTDEHKETAKQMLTDEFLKRGMNVTFK